MFIIVRGKKINKKQAYDILLDFDIKNIDDNNDKYCFLNWLDRNLGELIVDTCGNVGNNQYIHSEDYNLQIYKYKYLAEKYKYLSFIVILVDENSLYKLPFDVPFYQPSMNSIFSGFKEAFYINDGEMWGVEEDKAYKLYNEYRAEYKNDLIFNKRDYYQYINCFINEELIEQLYQIGKIDKKERDSLIRKFNKFNANKGNSIDNFLFHYNFRIKKLYEQYDTYRKCLTLLNKIYLGHKVPETITEGTKKRIKEYLNLMAHYWDNEEKYKYLRREYEMQYYFNSNYKNRSLIIETSELFKNKDYNIDYEMMAISKLDRVIDNIMQDVKQSAINKDYEMSNVDATNFRKIDDIIKNLNNNCKKSVLDLRKKGGHYRDFNHDLNSRTYVRYNNPDKGVFMGDFKQIDWLY